jgi:hypothetical protein
MIPPQHIFNRELPFHELRQSEGSARPGEALLRADTELEPDGVEI